MKAFLVTLLYLTCFHARAALPIYTIDAGRAKEVYLWQRPEQLAGLRAVTIVGAVKQPGTYLFKDSLPLADLVAASDPGSYATADRADLKKVHLYQTEHGVLEKAVIINVDLLSASSRKHELWLLVGGELVAVPGRLE